MKEDDMVADVGAGAVLETVTDAAGSCTVTACADSTAIGPAVRLPASRKASSREAIPL